MTLALYLFTKSRTKEINIFAWSVQLGFSSLVRDLVNKYKASLDWNNMA